MKFLYAIILSALSLSVPQLMKQEFKLPPTLWQIPFNPAWEMPSVPIQVLNQSFTYLTHGNQSHVFVSQDGNYVLKLFRYNRTRFAALQNIKSQFSKKPKADLFTKANKTFNAAYLACTEGKEFSAAIYCHLNLTKNQLPTIELIAGKTFQIPLDQYRFVIQKKAKSFNETLLGAKNNPELMHQLIDSWGRLILRRSAIGIRNADPNLSPNFGFLDNQAVEIDFGNYRKAPQTAGEIDQYFIRFEHWLAKHAPEYINYLLDLRTKT